MLILFILLFLLFSALGLGVVYAFSIVLSKIKRNDKKDEMEMEYYEGLKENLKKSKGDKNYV